MTPKQIQLVQSTWLNVLPIKESAAQLFYNRLFELDVSLKALFHGAMDQQGEKLMQVLDVAVSNLSQLDRLAPIVQQLGQRHVGYGAQDQHYATVGNALLWTLSQGLGTDFSEEVRDARSSAYHTLTSIMREAAATAPV